MRARSALHASGLITELLPATARGVIIIIISISSDPSVDNIINIIIVWLDGLVNDGNTTAYPYDQLQTFTNKIQVYVSLCQVKAAQALAHM